MTNSGSHQLNKLLNRKSGINSHGFDTIQVVGSHTASDAANNISQYKLNYDPNPIVIRKTDPRGPVEYKQNVYVRFLQPPPAPEPGPLVIKEERPPPREPLSPLIVRQRPPRPKTPPTLWLREMPPGQYIHGNGPRYEDISAERNAQTSRSSMHRSSKHYPYSTSYTPVTHEQDNDAIIRQMLSNSYGMDGGNSHKWITEVVRN